MLDHLAAIVFLATLAVGIGLLWGLSDPLGGRVGSDIIVGVAYGLIGFGIGGLLTLARHKR